MIFGIAAKRVRRADAAVDAAADARAPEHIIVVGYGRVGKFVASRLRAAGRGFILIEDQDDVIRLADEKGLRTVRGNAAATEILAEARIEGASHLLIAIPEGFEAGAIAETARKLKPGITIVARAHSREERDHLLAHGANRVIMGEEEIARQLVLSAS
jgi:CPA2 family monovalent cation:H+ antiporter-2